MKAEVIKNQIIQRIVFVFLFCLTLSLFWSVLKLDNYHALNSDIVSFLTGARIIREGEGRNLYNLDVQRKFQSEINPPHKKTNLMPFKNPPILAVFFIPLSFLSIFSAYKVYNLITISIALLISWISTKVFSNLKNSFYFLLPFLFYPSFATLFSGQISIFLLLAFLLILHFLKTKNAFNTGLVSGLLFLKFQYVISTPFVLLLTENKKDYLKGFVVSSLFVFLGSVFVSGLGFLDTYIKMTIETESLRYGLNEACMFTFYSSLSQFTSFSRQTIFFVNLFFYLIALLCFLKRYEKYSLRMNFAILTLLTLVFCLHGVNNDLALLLLPIWLIIDIYRGSKNVGAGVIFTVFILILSPLVYVLKISYLIPFLFLLSTLLMINKYKNEIQL